MTTCARPRSPAGPLSGTRCDMITLSRSRTAPSAPRNLHGRPGDLHQPDGGQAPDDHPRGVELEAAHAELGGPWMRMVVVVQTLAARHPGQGPRVESRIGKVLRPAPVP